MDRYQGKNTLSNTKSNTATAETSSSPARSHECPNTFEAEGIDSINKFMNMAQGLKEEINISLTEIKKRQTKSWKTSTNPLKKTKIKQSFR